MMLQRHKVCAAVLTGWAAAACCLPGGHDAWAQAGAASTDGPSATAPPPPSSLGPTQPPQSAESELEGVSQDLDRVDSLLLEGKDAEATVELDKAEERLKSIQESYSDAMPPGYVPLFVAEERLAGLRRQMSDPIEGQ